MCNKISNKKVLLLAIFRSQYFFFLGLNDDHVFKIWILNPRLKFALIPFHCGIYKERGDSWCNLNKFLFTHFRLKFSMTPSLTSFQTYWQKYLYRQKRKSSHPFIQIEAIKSYLQGKLN